jgi:hypothetical protein
MPENIQGSSATPPATSSATPASSGSPAPSAPIKFDYEQGAGPDLLADSPAESQVPSDQRPAQAGERVEGEGKPSSETPATPAGAADPLDAVLSYYTKGQKPAAEQTDTTKPETEVAPTADAFKAIEEKAEVVKAKLIEAGLDEKAAEQIINANKLVGRQSTELGEMRKTKAQFTEALQALQPVLESDEKGQIKGFHGVKLLEMATQKFGAEEVQKQLEAVGLRLVNVEEWNQARTGAGKDAGAAAREGIIRDVAKEYGIEGEDLSLAEIRSLIDADPNAKDALTERIAEAKMQQGRQAELTAKQKQEAESKETEAAQGVYQELQKNVPHFAELLPAMEALYAEHFHGGKQPNKANLLRLLASAAEGQTVGQRLPKILSLHKTQVEKALLKRLGIPESEVNLNPTATPSNVPQPKADDFTESFREVGPAMV